MIASAFFLGCETVLIFALVFLMVEEYYVRRNVATLTLPFFYGTFITAIFLIEKLN